jgi:hypothetical protein
VGFAKSPQSDAPSGQECWQLESDFAERSRKGFRTYTLA